MNRDLTFENVVSVIRDFQGISEKKLINASTFLEDGLCITGDDGADLLEEIEKQFLVSFAGKDGSVRDIFDLEENQYLFHSEGINILGWLLSLFGREYENVKPITVGQLYETTVKAKQRGNNG